MKGDTLALGAVAALALAGAVRRRGSRAPGEPLFHTTTWDRLQGISEQGLAPDAGSRFGGFYQGYSRGWTFLTDAEGAAGWFDKVSSATEAGTELRGWDESEIEDDLPSVVPVMLRVDPEGLTLEPDPIGQRDVFGRSWKTRDRVGPERIWFYDGSAGGWRPISQWDDSDPEAAFQQRTFEFDEDEVAEYQADPQGVELPQGWLSFVLRQTWHDDPGAFGTQDEGQLLADWDRQQRRRSIRGSRSLDDPQVGEVFLEITRPGPPGVEHAERWRVVRATAERIYLLYLPIERGRGLGADLSIPRSAWVARTRDGRVRRSPSEQIWKSWLRELGAVGRDIRIVPSRRSIRGSRASRAYLPVGSDAVPRVGQAYIYAYEDGRGFTFVVQSWDPIRGQAQITDYDTGLDVTPGISLQDFRNRARVWPGAAKWQALPLAQGASLRWLPLRRSIRERR